MRRLVATTALLALSLGSFAPTARATLARAMSLSELVHEAERVAVVRVRSHASRRDARRRIVTDVEVEVLEPLKGAADPFTIVRLGGELGEVGMAIAGEPSLVDGRRYLVFVRRGATGYRPVGMSQGVMPVKEEQGATLVEPGGGGLSLVDPTTGAHEPSAILGPMELDALLDEVRRLLRR